MAATARITFPFLLRHRGCEDTDDVDDIDDDDDDGDDDDDDSDDSDGDASSTSTSTTDAALTRSSLFGSSACARLWRTLRDSDSRGAARAADHASQKAPSLLRRLRRCLWRGC